MTKSVQAQPVQPGDEKKPSPRHLHFDALPDAKAEAERLLESGYLMAGNWTLGQNCRHCGDFMRYSVDGFPGFKLPWPITSIVRGLFLSEKKLAKPMPKGLPTAPAFKPPTDVEDAAEVAYFAEQLQRVIDHDGEFQKSPVFGKLTPEQWRQIHRAHCELHLGMLVPKTV